MSAQHPLRDMLSAPEKKSWLLDLASYDSSNCESQRPPSQGGESENSQSSLKVLTQALSIAWHGLNYELIVQSHLNLPLVCLFITTSSAIHMLLHYSRRLGLPNWAQKWTRIPHNRIQTSGLGDHACGECERCRIAGCLSIDWSVGVPTGLPKIQRERPKVGPLEPRMGVCVQRLGCQHNRPSLYDHWPVACCPRKAG